MTFTRRSRPLFAAMALLFIGTACSDQELPTALADAEPQATAPSFTVTAASNTVITFDDPAGVYTVGQWVEKGFRVWQTDDFKFSVNSWHSGDADNEINLANYGRTIQFAAVDGSPFTMVSFFASSLQPKTLGIIVRGFDAEGAEVARVAVNDPAPGKEHALTGFANVVRVTFQSSGGGSQGNHSLDDFTIAYPSKAPADGDADGVVDAEDNCPAVANADQADLDGDRTGDACDPDIDGDGVANGEDAFPRDASEQKDSDGDGVGDNADAFPNDPRESVDTDRDGVGNNGDNCPAVANADQADLDGDRVGDACDPDVDGDGAANGEDAFPRDASEQKDSDGDGVGDNADVYDHSNTGAALVVGTCNPGVANWHIGGGTWANDLIAAAQASAANHGAFVKAVSDLADGWKKSGKITGREQGAIASCAAKTK